MLSSVVFEPGCVVIAGARYALRDAGLHGEIQIGAEDGLILRPLTYGERARILMRMAGAPNTVDAVCAALLRAATVQNGAAERVVAEILALVLAGANADAPPFATTLLTVAGAAGWSLREIDDATAETIDQLALQLGASAETPDDGWSRIVLVDDVRPTSLDDVRRELAERLIARAGVVPKAVASDAAQTAADGAQTVIGVAENRAPLTHGAESSAAAEAWSADSTSSAPGRFASPSAGSAPDVPYSLTPSTAAPDNLRGDLSGRELNGDSETAASFESVGSVPTTDRPKFRLLGTQNLDGTSTSTSEPVRRPLNRISYQPEASASRGSSTTASVGRTQVIPTTAPPLELVRPVRTLPATGATRTDSQRRAVASPIGETQVTEPLATTIVDVPQTPRPELPAAPTLPTLAQIETLVGEDVADALAALLDLEADLRGIDR